MQDFTEIFYVIDPVDRLVRVSEEWTSFALANAGEDLAPESIVSHSLWEFITDEATRELYEAILARVRSGGETDLILRCDGPDRRRLIEMTVTRLPDENIQFKTTLLGAKTRPAQRLFDRSTPRTTATIMVCSWCDRVHVREDDEWLEVETAMERLHLTDEAELPQIAPMVCPSCFAKVLESLSQKPLTGP